MPAPIIPDSRTRFLQWTDCLLDVSRSAGDHRTAAHEWCQWALDTLGVDEARLDTGPDAFSQETALPNGQAISAMEAARCLRDYQRTAVFLRATDAAVRAAQERFPGGTIHLMEAGCGPLAPLALTAAVRYPPGKVMVTLLDLHPASLEAAQQLAAVLGVTGALRGCLAADAATVQFQDAERPHIIVCEMLHRALTKEPQAAVTGHLAGQLRPGGIFLPERIEIVAALVQTRRLYQRMMMTDCTGTAESDADTPDPVQELGAVFTLDPATAATLAAHPGARIPAGRVTIPAHDPASASFRLLTRIQVFRDHRLGDYESAITLPEPVHLPAALAETGAVAGFTCEISATPGLRAEFLPL